MIRLGIFTHVYQTPPAEQAATIKSLGFDCVQLRPDGLQDAASVNADSARAEAAPFQDAGLEIAALAGYTNLVAPDPAGVERFYALVRHCRAFGTRYIATETGSLNPESPWEDHPDNHTEAAWQRLLPVLRKALSIAEDNGVTLLVEAYVNNIVATVRDAARLMNDLPSPALGFVLDPNNYFQKQDCADVKGHLRRVFETIGSRAPIAHAKDIRYDGGRITTPRAGAGILDYAEFIRLLKQHQPDARLIMEHLQAGEVGATKEWIETFLK